jgi:hypothetical protein
LLAVVKKSESHPNDRRFSMPRTRVSIASLMAVVLIVSFSLAALRSYSMYWANAVLLVSCGILSVGVVGIACGGTSGRAWWAGFSVFGWGYMFLTIWLEPWRLGGIWSPILGLASSVTTALGVQRPQRGTGFFDFGEDWSPPPAGAIIAQALASLVFAMMGGTLCHFLFAGPTAPLIRPTDEARTESRRHRRTALIVGLTAIVLVAVAAVTAARKAPGTTAGAIFLLTWGLLVLAALRAGLNRGSTRARWLGAALFGAGYLLLVSGHREDLTWPQYTSNELLNAARPWLPAIPTERRPGSDSVATANERILKSLEWKIPIHCAEPTPLTDVLASIKSELRHREEWDIPIYVDPVGLQEAEKTMQSPVQMEMNDVPLRTTLGLLLRQLGMIYEVRGGLIHITSAAANDFDPVPAYVDPYLLIGQCVLALLAACLGGVAAPIACGCKD